MVWGAYKLAITPACKHCEKKDYVRKHGKSKCGLQRYRCEQCHKTFQVKYIYNAYRSAFQQEVIERYLTGESIWEISQKVNVNPNTIRRYLDQEQLIHGV